MVTKEGKGILVSPTAHGNLLVGPTASKVASPDSKDTTAEGLAIVEKFASEGWTVVFTGRDSEKVRAAEQAYREKFPQVEIIGYQIDSLLDERTVDEASVEKMFAFLDEKGITVDTLVLNAADQGLGMKIFELPSQLRRKW